MKMIMLAFSLGSVRGASLCLPSCRKERRSSFSLHSLPEKEQPVDELAHVFDWSSIWSRRQGAHASTSYAQLLSKADDVSVACKHI